MRIIFFLAVTCALLCGPGNFVHPESFLAYCEEDRKTEYEAICAKTADPTALTPGEVKSLIERRGRLKPRIERLDESAAKVYLKRLGMCRNLFVFMLESKAR